MSASTTYATALPELEEELEAEFEGEEFLGGLARQAAQAVLGSLGARPGGEGELEAEHEYELEGEWEGEFEGEGMANPLRRAYPDAMMEHLGHAAAEAETEAEAEAFIGALAPIAAGLARSALPAAAPAITRSIPQLVRGLSTVTRTLRRNPATRDLVRVVPTIASRTTRSLARQASRGRPITARGAARTLAGQTAAVLSDPRVRGHAVRRARALDRTYHRAVYGDYPTASIRGRAPRPGLRPARPVARTTRQPGYPRHRGYPPGMSVAWVPVPAWYGYPPEAADRRRVR